MNSDIIDYGYYGKERSGRMCILFVYEMGFEQ